LLVAAVLLVALQGLLHLSSTFVASFRPATGRLGLRLRPLTARFAQNFKSMKVAELKELCTEKGLETSGKKADLVARLEEAWTEVEDEVAEEESGGADAEEAEAEEEEEKPKPKAKKASAKPGEGPFAEDEVVEAYFEDDQQWYPGKVTKDLGGTYEVAWTEDEGSQECGPGYIRKQLSEVDRDGPFMPGEAVKAFYEEENTWYTGIIQTENKDGTFTLLWDEDGEEYNAKPEAMIKLAPTIPVDELERGQQLRGIVKRIKEFGAFIDVGAETDGLMRPGFMKPVERAADAPAFDKGERVTALYAEEEEWYPGTVDAVNKDGSFMVLWDDYGEEEPKPEKVQAKDMELESPRMSIKEGEILDVWVSNVRDGKFALSMYEGGRQAPVDLTPFEKMPLDEFVEGEILKVIPAGFIVKFKAPTGEEGKGLVHISRIRDGYVESAEDEGSQGDKVKVRVEGVDTERQRINLSMKEVLM